jgi:hypothetical protein
MSEMQEIQKNLISFLDKAYDLTIESFKLVQKQEFEQLNTVLANRERAISIIDSLSQNLSMYQKVMEQAEYNEFNNQVSLVIEKINSIDEIVMSCLEHEKNKTQFEIAKSHKNKENFKGYNLNNVK